jgi:phosphatidate cytidylyltransferase
MLGTRIITAFVGVAVAVIIVNYGQWVFAGSVLILACLSWQEFVNMMVRREIAVAYSTGLIAILFLWGAAWLGNSQETVAILIITTFIVLVKTVLFPVKLPLMDAMFTLGGIIYIGLSFSHMILLRFCDSLILSTKLGSIEIGSAYLWLAFVGTWSSDTFAYFIGSYLGKHKLAPAISPAKTWEGTGGGMLGSILGIILMGTVFKFSLLHCVLIGLIIGIVAPLGDLVESAIKRYAGVKDSGRLLPGHGGVLDRFDSVMFVIPVIYYYISIFF